MNYGALWNEINSDPLARGYAGMTDAQVAASLNGLTRTRTRTTLSSAEIYERTDVSEFQALNATQKDYVRDIFSLGDSVQVGPGSKARAVLVSAFGTGSNTIVALAAALNESISRADELGLGTVLASHVAKARAQNGG